MNACENSFRSFTRWVIATLVIMVLGVAVFYVGSVSAAEIRIPESSALYRVQLERSAGRYFGLDAPVATLAAQLHQESGWRPRAQSKFADGLAQFTPATAKWLPDVCPELGKPDPWNPTWSLGAVACYDAWLYARVQPIGDTPLNDCTRWHFALRGYNGGERWLERERRMALAANQDANAWQTVARHRARATWAHTENTGYPRRILLTLEPVYRTAGWPGRSTCP